MITNKKFAFLAALFFYSSISSLTFAMSEDLEDKKSKTPISLQDQQVLEELNSLSKYEETTTRQVQDGLWLHVHVKRNAIKAKAEVWTTKGHDEGSERISVGSIRLGLQWASYQEDTVNNTYHHSLYEWSTYGVLTKAKATAWLKGPDFGPIRVKTKR